MPRWRARGRWGRAACGLVARLEASVVASAIKEIAMPRIVCGAVALVALAGCGPIMSSQVADQINGMVGLSKEHVLSCMGPPTSTSSAGATEVWTYNSLGPVNSSTVLSGNQSFVVGSTSTSQEFCAINLTMQSDRVVMANYRSQGKLLAPSLPCYSVLHACVPNPGTASAQAESTQGERSKEAFAYCKELFKDPRLRLHSRRDRYRPATYAGNAKQFQVYHRNTTTCGGLP